MSNLNRVFVKPELLTWARRRKGVSLEVLQKKFPKILEWEEGISQPTLKQIEKFVKTVHVPIGYLFLPEPPEESLPIPDFRTISDQAITDLNVNLLDTIYLCQEKQAWYRDYLRSHKGSGINSIGSAVLSDSPAEAAESIRIRLNFSMDERREKRNQALTQLVSKIEDVGVLVMLSSIVGSNSHRKLEVSEFRGFALFDTLAPLIFINAADSKAAQMFTLAHELAHLWLGQSGVSDTEAGKLPQKDIERWCNEAAAELLMPMKETREAYQSGTYLPDEIQRLANYFKVSNLVVLRRLFDAGFINETTFWKNYHEELERIGNLKSESSSGGNFYHTLRVRNGKHFARAVIESTLEGQTLFQDALRMLGLKKSATFYQAARELGVTA